MISITSKISALAAACILFPLAILSNSPEINIVNGRVVLSDNYEPHIPAPHEIIGYHIGERFTDYRNLERYVFALAEASDRVELHEYGTTYQHRPLRVLYISSPQNLNRLDELKSNNLRLSDPRDVSDERAEQIIDDSPVFVWLAYSVHGNEASTTEAALLTMYHLAASTDEEIIDALEDVVVVLDPLVNPDGRERYVNYINDMSQRNPNPDPHAAEHTAPWPRGRTNHYFFDLNRDWAWLTQQETRQRVNLYRQFMPQVYIDYHEMGRESTYFFFPATPPFHPNYPEEVQEWGKVFGKGNASMLDRHGIPYYTGEVFDLFYPGYGDSWPTFNGAIGMTYEQSGGGTGRAYERKDGHILTLAERAHNHFLTGIASINTAQQSREELLRYFYSFWLKGVEGPSGSIRSVLMKEGKDPNRTADLVDVLLHHGIEVHRTTIDQNIRNLTRFFETTAQRQDIPAGSYVINFNQPKSKLAKTLLEPHSDLPDTFFFDITAWSLPAAYNTDAYWGESVITSNLEPVTGPVRIPGTVGDKASYAYLIPWDRSKAAVALWELLKKEYSAHFAMRSFSMQENTFPRGTIVIYTHLNNDELHNDITDIAEKHGIDIYSTDTGLSDEGIDLGSNHIRPIVTPKIAVATDRPTIPNEYGEIWYLFDNVYGIPFTPLKSEQIANADLSRYNVLILPGDRSGRGYSEVLDSTAVNKIRSWVRKGGVLITTGGASQFATKEQSELTNVASSPRNNDENSNAEKERKEKLKRMGLQERQEFLQRERIAGALLRIELDTTHPIGFGYDDNVVILKRGSETLQLTENGYNVGIFKEETPVSGYAWDELVEKIHDTAYVIDYPLGEGNVVLFSDNPHFRMFWHGLTKMFINATLFLH